MFILGTADGQDTSGIGVEGVRNNSVRMVQVRTHVCPKSDRVHNYCFVSLSATRVRKQPESDVDVESQRMEDLKLPTPPKHMTDYVRQHNAQPCWQQL